MHRVLAVVCCFVCFVSLSCGTALASELAELTGYVSDPTGARVRGCRVEAINIATNIPYFADTNEIGLYRIPTLPVGTYRVMVQKQGFKTVVKQGIEMHVQDVLSLNFQLEIGAIAETISVIGGASTINTESAAVSTVVDRNFADNLPMNGRSFQTLVQLTPGVVTVPTDGTDGGQFSVNGQRPSSNYWMVDGVSANVGLSATSQRNGIAGGLGSFSVLGGTNSLVSVDAMQEFRIQTSTYAPEFGRTPGAQISIATRSGTNQFHGTLFDYLRNDVLDANDWFANSAGQPKPRERQNDFGGTFSGPLVKNRTFFFFSYEGLRLRLPQVALTTVPDAAARAAAAPGMQPFLNAFPLDTSQPDLGGGVAQFNKSFSDPAVLDAYSLRIDHNIKDKLAIFGRYNYSPSEIDVRGSGGSPLSVVTAARIVTQTATAGVTWTISPVVINDFRFNFSRTSSSSNETVDSFGGAVPPGSLGLPSPFTAQNSLLVVGVFGLKNGATLEVGRVQESLQRQFNTVDAVSLQRGPHSVKFGVDHRHLTPVDNPLLYRQAAVFLGVPAAEAGKPLFTTVQDNLAATFSFNNLGVYAQDTWRANRHLTLTYGLRWDVDFAPSSTDGPSLAGVTGYNLSNLSTLALAPAGVPPFNTRYGSVAPRLGVAYQITESAAWQTVVRGGGGVFYDLATAEFGTLLAGGSYPFSASKRIFGGAFPLSSAAAAAPPITVASLGLPPNVLGAINPHLQAPYTIQWNAAIEQQLGKQQSLSLSYVGSSGRRLLGTAFVSSPNASFNAVQLVDNAATSSYDAMQLQFQRRLAHGLQALASYTWSHSIDDGSAGSATLRSNALIPGLGAQQNRGPSDFDIRHAFSAGLTYNIPGPRMAILKQMFGGWSTENFVVASSAPPVDVLYSTIAFNATSLFNSFGDVRPDLVPGQPLYLFGAQCIQVLGPPCAGGRGLNPAAFAPPPLDPVTQMPLRQGNLGRNALRGFDLTQWDLAMHRDFPMGERLKLQFRAELFNVLNHANFGPPEGDLGDPLLANPQFGQSQFMLGRSLAGPQFAGSVGNGSFNPLYQIGGPRSVQFALRVSF